MKLFKTLKRKAGNAIVPVLGTILGLTVLAGAVVGVALNTSRIVYREDKLQKQNDARQILYIAAKYFCDQKNNNVADSDIVAELQEIFGLGLKVTKNKNADGIYDGTYYVWYPNQYENGETEYREWKDSDGVTMKTNVSEWLKAKIVLTQSDADDGSGNKDAELSQEIFRKEAKIDEKFAIGNLMTVYMTDEELLPGRKWKLNEVSLVKSDIDTFDEAYSYFNNAGTLLIDDIGYALYAYQDITSGDGGGFTSIYQKTGGKADYELVYSTDYIGGNYYWQNSNKVDTTTWIYKQEYDMEMLAGMLNLYYTRAHTGSANITTENSVYYLYKEETGQHILKASEDETDESKMIICENNLEFAEKLSFYVFWTNMERLCLKLNDFVEALLDTFDEERKEARYEYIWTDKGLTVNAFHRNGNYWPYYFTISEIKDILCGLGMTTSYKYVKPTLSGDTYNHGSYSDYSAAFSNELFAEFDGQDYTRQGYDVIPSNTYNDESYEVIDPDTKETKTYYLFYTKGIDETAPIKYFDSYRGDYFTVGNKAYKFDAANTGKNNPGTTKEAYLTYGTCIYADTKTGETYGTGSEQYTGYSKVFTYESNTIDTEYRCYDEGMYYAELYRWAKDGQAEYNYTDENGLNYTCQDGNYSKCFGINFIDYNVTIQYTEYSDRDWRGRWGEWYSYQSKEPSWSNIQSYNNDALSYVNNSSALYAQITPISGNGYNASDYYTFVNKTNGTTTTHSSILGTYRSRTVTATYKIRFLVCYDYDYSVLNNITLGYQDDTTLMSVETGFSGEYHTANWINNSVYMNENGIWKKYRQTEGKYRYYYFPQYAYRELEQDDDGPFYYGYVKYKSEADPEFDYEKMYSRLLSLKELDISKQYSGGRELNNYTYTYITENVTKKIKEGERPADGSQYQKLYDDIYKYAWDTITSTYTPSDGGVPSLLGGTDLVAGINGITHLKIIDGSDNYIISFQVEYDRYKYDSYNEVFTDEIERNQTYYMADGSTGVEPFTFTFEEFKAKFVEGILIALGKTSSQLLDPDVQYTIRTRAKEEVMEDLVTPIRYQYLPTTKYYEIFGDTRNKQGLKEEQLYNKLLAYYFDAEDDDTIYRYKSASYTTSGDYSNYIIIDVTCDLYNSDNNRTGSKTIRFAVTPVTWNLLNTNNEANLIQDDYGNYVLENYKLDGDYKPVAIKDMDGNILDLADLRDTSLPAILGTLPLKVREQKASTPTYAKNNQKISINGTAYEKISVGKFKKLIDSNDTITITKNTLVDGNVEFLAPNDENEPDLLKNIKIVINDGCSLYINGTLYLRDNQDVQLGNNSLLFVNSNMFITYEYMGYLDKYSNNPQTATQINSASDFGVQSTNDYNFYKDVGVDILAGTNSKIIINGNLDYKGYKARYTRSTSLMQQVLSRDEWRAYSRISADKILYEQSVFNAHESVEDNQNSQTGKWTHVTEECRSRLEGIYIINGDVKFRAWDEKNTTNDASNATTQAVSMYRNCYSNPLVNATFYVDGAFDMRGMFVSGLYDLCRANFVFAKSIIQPSISLNTIYSKDNRSGLTNNPQGDNIYAGWGDTHGYLFIICEDAIDFSKANFGCLNIFTPYAEMLSAIESNGQSNNNFTKYIAREEFLKNYPDKNVVNTWGLPSILKNGFDELYSPNDIGSIIADNSFDWDNNIEATKPKEDGE